MNRIKWCDDTIIYDKNLNIFINLSNPNHIYLGDIGLPRVLYFGEKVDNVTFRIDGKYILKNPRRDTNECRYAGEIIYGILLIVIIFYVDLALFIKEPLFGDKNSRKFNDYLEHEWGLPEWGMNLINFVRVLPFTTIFLVNIILYIILNPRKTPVRHRSKYVAKYISQQDD